MDFLLALVATPLSKALEVCFITGLLTAYRLESSRRLKGGVLALPAWQKKQARRGSKRTPSAALARVDSTGRDPKSLPNDPQKQGNIWHRYEQLENATKSLSNVNQQLIDERAQHKKEKKRLEDTIGELRLHATSSSGHTAATPLAAPLSPESKAVIQELESPRAIAELRTELSDVKSEMQRLTEELSNSHNQLEFLKSENQDLQSDNLILQRKVDNDGSTRRRSSRGGELNVPPISPFGGATGHAVGPFAEEVASKAAAMKGAPQPGRNIHHGVNSNLTSFGSDIEMNPNLLMSTQSSESLERAANAQGYGHTEQGQLQALKQENKLLKETLEKSRADSGAAVGGGLFVGTSVQQELREKLKKLQEENQRLQNKVLRLDQEPVRDQGLEEKYNKLLEENTRLQSKVVRLNLGSTNLSEPPVSVMEELKDLKEENTELREDNDKLLSYLEGLEEEKKELEAAVQQKGGRVEASGQGGHLQSENLALREELKKLNAGKPGALNRSSGSFTTVHVPVAVETGEEMDRDLWMLVEELRDQNRKLIEEVQGLQKNGVPVSNSSGVPSNASARIAELERLLSEASASKSVEMNDNNSALVKLLADENASMQQENMRLVKVVAERTPAAEREVLADLISSNERLIAEKQKVVSQCQYLTEKNARLSASHDTLVHQAKPAEQPIAKADNSKGTPTKGLLSRFGRTLRKKSSNGKEIADEDLQVASEEGSMSSAGGQREPPQPSRGNNSPRELVQELIDENTRLNEDNRRLAESSTAVRELQEANQKLQEEKEKLQAGAALMKELSDESARLTEENKTLTERLNAVLVENRDLSARLIDSALQHEGDVFDVAFGETPPSDTRSPPPSLSPAARERQQAEIAAQMRDAEQRNKRNQARTEELQARTTRQLESLERRSSGSQAYKKSAANAMARLNSLSQRASLARETSGSEPSNPSASVSPEVQSLERTRGSNAESLTPEEGPPRGTSRARSDLSRRIEASRAKAPEGFNPRLSASTLPELRRPDDMERAEAKVRQAYVAHCGTDDLGSFMAALGYSAFQEWAGVTQDPIIIDVFQNACNITSEIQISPASTLEDKTLAKVTHNYLQDWYLQYTSG